MRALALSLALLALGGVAHAQTYLGVLEDQPGRFAGEGHRSIVRVAFINDASGWRAAQGSIARIDWTIGFDGREVGHITGRATTSPDRGVQEIEAGAIPRIGAPSEAFSGWLATPVQRPLAASSISDVTDPESWRRTQLDPAALRSIRRAFRARFPVIENCANANENVARPWSFADDTIELQRAYRNSGGWRVATLLLQGYNCDGPTDDPGADADPFLTQVFAISPSGQVQLLGEGMWLVDAGDYDGDGASELIFAIDRYNRGGYELFSDNFAAHAVFSFSYH